jgi:putative membrane protein
MTLRWVLAAVHLIGLGISFGAIWGRAAAFRNIAQAGGVPRVLRADNWWGVSALVLLATGLPRLFGSTEKATAYYLQNDLFWAKMGVFALVLLLELWPMITLIRWRLRLAAQESIDTSDAPRFATISYLQALLLVLLTFLATGMARGYLT